MSAHVWSRLAAPFPLDVVAWSPIEVAEGGDLVHVVAHLAPAALRERLDGVLGVAGWSVRYEGLVGGAIACHVSVEGVTKGAVAPAAIVGGVTATAEAAFAAAADLLGLRAPVPVGASFWLPCDPETLEPLHPPDLGDVAAMGVTTVGHGEPDAPAGPTEDRTAARFDAPVAGEPPVASGVAAEPGAAAPGVAPPGVAATGVAAPGVAATDVAPVAKPTGQQMIDRLVERLKGEGQGLAAARLLVKYGGYGKDPEAARELYAQLRELLLAAPAGEGSAGRG